MIVFVHFFVRSVRLQRESARIHDIDRDEIQGQVDHFLSTGPIAPLKIALVET